MPPLGLLDAGGEERRGAFGQLVPVEIDGTGQGGQGDVGPGVDGGHVVPRRAAQSNPKRTARSEAADPSTPMTTVPEPPVGRSRTTTTGVATVRSSSSALDPSRTCGVSVWPEAPRTSRPASAAAPEQLDGIADDDAALDVGARCLLTATVDRQPDGGGSGLPGTVHVERRRGEGELGEFTARPVEGVEQAQRPTRPGKFAGRPVGGVAGRNRAVEGHHDGVWGCRGDGDPGRGPGRCRRGRAARSVHARSIVRRRTREEGPEVPVRVAEGPVAAAWAPVQGARDRRVGGPSRRRRPWPEERPGRGAERWSPCADARSAEA